MLVPTFDGELRAGLSFAKLYRATGRDAARNTGERLTKESPEKNALRPI